MYSSAFTSIIALSLVISSTACSKGVEESPAYQAACHGSPLRSIENRTRAIEDGYSINRQYDCIDKASFAAIEREQAEWKAAHTPEAIAQREAEFSAQRERALAEQARQSAAVESSAGEPLPEIVLRDVDVNTAPESEIASVISVGTRVAAQIVEERNKRRFSNWTDLVNRVVGLSAAQSAFYASVCGLTVDGRSLDGALPNPAIAATLQRKYQQRQPN